MHEISIRITRRQESSFMKILFKQDAFLVPDFDRFIDNGKVVRISHLQDFVEWKFNTHRFFIYHPSYLIEPLEPCCELCTEHDVADILSNPSISYYSATDYFTKGKKDEPVDGIFAFSDEYWSGIQGKRMPVPDTLQEFFNELQKIL